jgi:hypothetical protein
MAPNQVPLSQSNILADLDVESLPDNLKKEGADWFAVFNPRARRVLDVELIHNLPHQSVVCCVRFSLDGRFVATGCNRSAQIFDVETGSPVAHLQDGSLSEDGDLYIRSVCFSPNGAYLATGAEDKVIRVGLVVAVSLVFLLTFCRSGTLRAARLSTNSLAMSKTSIRWTLPAMAVSLHLEVVTAVSVYGIWRRISRFSTYPLKTVSPLSPFLQTTASLRLDLSTRVFACGMSSQAISLCAWRASTDTKTVSTRLLLLLLVIVWSAVVSTRPSRCGS